MDIELLQNFIILVKTKNFSVAAEECFISQSTLSKRIKKLEKELDIELFKRNTKNVELTPYGIILNEYADKIIKLEKDCLSEINALLPSNQNKLTIGAIPSLAKYHLTDLIKEFINQTKINCSIITSPSEKLEILLKEEKCDAAFIRHVQDPENIFYKKNIISDTLTAILPFNHRLADRQFIKISELKDENFVLLPEGSRPYNNCINLCKKNGFNPHVVFTDASITNILDFVGNGLGVSLLMSKNILDSTNKDIIAIPLIPAVEESLALCMLKDERKKPAIKALLNFIDKKYL